MRFAPPTGGRHSSVGGARPFLRALVPPLPHPFPPGAPLVHRRRTRSRHSHQRLRARSAPTVATNPLLPPRALTRTAHPFPHPCTPGAPLVLPRRTPSRHSHQRLRARSAPTVATNPHGAPVSARRTRFRTAHPFPHGAPLVHRRRTHFRHSHQRLRARSAPTVATNPLLPPGAPLVHRRRTRFRHSHQRLRGRSAPTVATNPLLPPRAHTRTAHPFPPAHHSFTGGAPISAIRT
ncbi:hypothetical protein ABIE37_002381 [Arthrobacter bambusae]|uniref:Uncharacterized protein n=1 Tax=Arthrobacter bambusae TaxID=1338426 RepID=A0ABV2P744_9MICC